MHSLILSQWKEHRMGVIWQDLRALTTVRARDYYDRTPHFDEC